MPKYQRKPTIVDVQLMTSVKNFGALGTLNTGDALIAAADGNFYSLSCSSFYTKYTAMTDQNQALTGTDIL